MPNRHYVGHTHPTLENFSLKQGIVTVRSRANPNKGCGELEGRILNKVEVLEDKQLHVGVGQKWHLELTKGRFGIRKILITPIPYLLPIGIGFFTLVQQQQQQNLT